MGSLTDISHLKWAQGLQERRLREAEEAKRQQNEFIDITSHEMRSSFVPARDACEKSADPILQHLDPLSAILICAEDIRDTLTQHKFSSSTDQQMAKDCIEAADNIALCVQHQKSIVDDILTVSKLDSNLLRITPIHAQPIIVVQRSMAMLAILDLGTQTGSTDVSPIGSVLRSKPETSTSDSFRIQVSETLILTGSFLTRVDSFK
jgi:signal transduction histidine kinase